MSKQQEMDANPMEIHPIGYVQIKRTEKFCTIIAACCPEQSVHSKSYRVQVEVDSENSKIKSAVCHDCVASAGGCKHSLAVLGCWLHRESEKKSVTGRDLLEENQTMQSWKHY